MPGVKGKTGVYKKTEEHKENLSKALKNKPRSKETKKKISLVHKGKKKTDEHRRKISIAVSVPRPNRCGKNNHFWKGGITKISLSVRTSLSYRVWRRSIFKRDNYTCQKKGCGQRGGKLNVDHYPKTFSQLLTENKIKSLDDAINCKALWDLENNRTLCEGCHRKTKTFGKIVK